MDLKKKKNVLSCLSHLNIFSAKGYTFDFVLFIYYFCGHTFANGNVVKMFLNIYIFIFFFK